MQSKVHNTFYPTVANVGIIVTPKCACSFVKHWIYYQEQYSPSIEFNEIKRGRDCGIPGKPGIHILMTEMDRNKFVLPTDLTTVKHYQFIRNPYSRFLSGYNEKIANANNPVFYKPDLTIDDFIDKMEKIDLSSYQDYHWRLQSVGGPKSIDKTYLKIEDGLQQHLDNISMEFSLPIITIKKDKINPSPENPKCKELSEAQKEKVFNMYKQDFETFNYPK